MADELITTQVVASGPEIVPSGIVPSQPMEMRQTGMRTDIPEGTVDYAPDPVEMQAEIERLKKVKEKAEQDAAYWRKQKAEARADYFKSRGQGPPEPPHPQVVEDLGVGPEPKTDDFDDYQKYNDAKIKYEVNKAKAIWDREQTKKEADEARAQRMADFQLKLDRGYQKYEDFGQLVIEDQTVPIGPMVLDILTEVENPEEIAYYLAKNRIEAIQISRMTPTKAAIALHEIEVKMAKAASNPPSGTKKVTSAPPPIKPVGSGQSVAPNLEKMTQKEYEAWAKQNPGLKRF